VPGGNEASRRRVGIREDDADEDIYLLSLGAGLLVGDVDSMIGAPHAIKPAGKGDDPA